MLMKAAEVQEHDQQGKAQLPKPKRSGLARSEPRPRPEDNVGISIAMVEEAAIKSEVEHKETEKHNVAV